MYEGKTHRAADNVNPELCPLDIRIESTVNVSLLDLEIDAACAQYILMSTF
jgi:hypothetical protein